MSHHASLDPALQAAIRKVGAFAKNQFVNFSSSHIQYKGKNNLVSYVDIESEKMLRDAFGHILPDSSFIGEEGVDEYGGNGYTWIIDPVDGTTNYTHGVPFWAISVALMHDQELVLGYVYEVMHDELFSAIKGQGTLLNGSPIRVSDTPGMDKALLATGFPYTDFSFLEEYMLLFTDFIRASHGLRRFGSAALDLAYVAAGRFDGFFEFGLNPWDVAAGILLVREAGGRCTTFSGDEDCVFARQTCAGNTQVHAQMLQIVEHRMAGKI